MKNIRKVTVVRGSPRVTIPPAIAALVGIEKGTMVKWSVSGKKLILEVVKDETHK